MQLNLFMEYVVLYSFRPQRRVSLGSSDRGEDRPGGPERRIFHLARYCSLQFYTKHKGKKLSKEIFIQTVFY